MTYQMEEYRQEAGRTAKDLDIVRDDIWENHGRLGHDLTTLAVAGQQADIAKRALFYKEPIEKGEERAAKFVARMDEIYSKLGEISRTDEHHKFSAEEINILHAAMGLMSESAEIIEAVLDAFINKKNVDKVNLKEEAGDGLWYIALLLRTIGVTFEEAAFTNAEKLKKRYPEKFNTEQALNRNEEAERKVLVG